MSASSPARRGRSPRTLVMYVDVTDESSVNDLAARALDTFGRIDVCVNNAGAATFGCFEQTSLADHRRVIETDLFGTIYGTRAALPIFQRQGGGVLINTGSLDSKLSEPYMSSYFAAKHAIAGLGMALRLGARGERLRRNAVCTVMPETVGTPFFQHAANYSGRAVKAMPPVLSAERVARAIVRMAEHPRREVFVGLAARQFWLQYLLAPGLTERLFALLADNLQLARDATAPTSQGCLCTPMAEGTGTSGGWMTKSGLRQGDRGDVPWKPLRAGLCMLVPAIACSYVWRVLSGRPSSSAESARRFPA